MKQNTFKSAIGWVGLSEIILFVLSFVMSILNARFLGPAGLGVFALLRLMQSLGVQLTDFGFGRSLRYYSANGEIDYYDLTKVIFILGPIVGGGLIFISLVLKYLPLNIWNDIDLNVYLLFLPSMFFFSVTMYLRFLLHGQLLIKAIAVSELLERILYILLFVIFVCYLDWGLVGVSLSLSISSVFLFLQLYFTFKSHHPNKSTREKYLSNRQILKKLWGYGRWTYYSSFIVYVLNNFPVLFLKSSVGSFELIGYFNKSKGLSEYVNRPAKPLSGLLFSYNAGSSAIGAAKRTEQLCRLTFWISSTLFWMLALFIRPVIATLYGDAFLPAADIFILLYPNVVFGMNGMYLNAAIAARGYNKETYTIRLQSLPIIITITYLLISNLHIKGAALALSISAVILWVQYLIKYLSIAGSSVGDVLLIKKEDIDLIKHLWKKIRNRNTK